MASRATTLTVNRGEVVRFYLTNASNARLFNVSFPGARMKVVASDVGKFEREEWVSSVVLAPAERYVVDVEFARAGRTALVNRIQALDHMFGTFSPVADTLGQVRVSGVPAAPNATPRNSHGCVETLTWRPSLHRFDRCSTRRRRIRSCSQCARAGCRPPSSNMLIGINAAVEWNDGMAMMNWIATSQGSDVGASRSGDGQGEHGHRLAISASARW